MAEAAREIYSKVLSDNLNFLMKLHGYTRKQVSAEIDVPYTTFTDWVKGKTYPKIEGIQKLADFFEIEVYDLSRDISEDRELVKRLTAYAKGINNMFEHKSLKQRIDEYNGQIEVYEYDWSDLMEGEYFDE